MQFTRVPVEILDVERTKSGGGKVPLNNLVALQVSGFEKAGSQRVKRTGRRIKTYPPLFFNNVVPR